MKSTRGFLTLTLLAALLVPLGAEAGVKRRARAADSGFQVRFGGMFLDGDSDFWADNEALFTLDTADFDDATLGLTFSRAFNNHFEMDFNIDFYDDRVVSEYRDYTDGGGFPILHDTRLEATPVTAGVRFLPFGRYGANGPRPVFFVGAGAGVNFWRYQEVGDFIDFSDPNLGIVFGRFRERDAAFVSYGTAGFEMPVGPRFNLGLEARYFSSDDKLNGDFAGLGTLDLSGFGAYVSGNWRF